MNPAPPEVATIRATLLAQHAELRVLVARCAQLARRLDAGEAVGGAFAGELARLRAAFVAHNELEARVLEPLLAADDAWGPMRIDDMLDHHAAEHADFFVQLDHTTGRIAHEFVAFAQRLESHMVGEERTFLSRRVLNSGARAPAR